MSSVTLFTSFTYTYMSRARVLAQTARRFHPDWKICAVIVDTPPAGFDDSTWREEFDSVLDAAELFPGNWRSFVFKHDVVEACTAVKGQALLHFLNEGADKVIYLDPDIAVFSSLRPIVDRLETSSIVLTPHQVEPNAREEIIAENEAVSMQYGVFNLGFIAIRNDVTGCAFARWWTSRLFHACYDDVKNGVFTDQKYCDLVPGLFANVHVERDPGFNVASWNLSQRAIAVTRQGDIEVNGRSLRFYHFTKINSDGDGMTAKYAAGRLAVFEIWNWYRRAIKALELPGVPPRYWRYGRFDDGTAIPKIARAAYRSNPLLMSRFRDPFASGPDSFQDWFRINGSDGPATADGPLSTASQPAANGSASSGAGGVAVVIHAFYPDLLLEIMDRLQRYRGTLAAYVTTTPDKLEAVKDIMRSFTGESHLSAHENRGRDVLPFLRVLPDILSRHHGFVLKLHTKRSTHRNDGDLWRRELLDTLADPAELAWMVQQMARRPDVGIIGPRGHVLDMDAYWGSNEATVRRLSDKIGMKNVTPDPNVFVAGTMFMARKEALAAAASLRLTTRDFEEEAGQTDATMAHAVERFFTFSAAARGLRVAGKPSRAAGSAAGLVYGGATDYQFAPRSDVPNQTRFGE